MSTKRTRINPPPSLKLETNCSSLKEENGDATTSSSAQESSHKGQIELSWPSSLGWIKENWTWPRIRIALRCAVAGWVSSVLFAIPKVQLFMGQASFLILISAFLSPPSDPFFAVLERELLILFFVAATWAWSCLGIFLANLARQNSDSSIPLQTALTSNGRYVEAAPSVILAAFIFIGTAVLLYVRARQGPGPYVFATLFACICLITTLTTAVLVPFPYYIIGRSLLIPLIFHSGISLLASLLLFPESLSTNFTNRLAGVLSPLQKSTGLHLTLLKATPDAEGTGTFKENIDALLSTVAQSEAALAPLSLAARLLPTDVVYARYSPRDWRPLQDLARRIAVRAHGMTIYFTLIDPNRERFPITPVTTRPASPATTRPGTPVERHQEPPHHHHLSSLLHLAHLHHHNRHHHRSPSHAHGHGHHYFSPAPVGVFESQRYLDLEAHVFHDPRTEYHTAQTHELLKKSCVPLLERCSDALECLAPWFRGAGRKNGRLSKLSWAYFASFVNSKNKNERRAKERQQAWDERVDGIRRVRTKLLEELARFRRVTRVGVVQPYENLLGGDPAEDGEIAGLGDNGPSHRYLFNCYVYQYNLMRFADMLGEMLDHVIRLETKAERSRRRVWTPKVQSRSIKNFVRWLKAMWSYRDGVGASGGSGEGEGEEEDPDRVQHVDRSRARGNEADEEDDDDVTEVDEENMYGMYENLPDPRRRDPDALPPGNILEKFGTWVYRSFAGMLNGNALFAIKAGGLTTLMCLPFFLKSSAQFAYQNRFLWGIVMAQLTSARFRGDTTFGFLTRIFSTFLGGGVGLVMWYICAPTGIHYASPYSLSAVFAVCFPFFFFIRLYFPGPPMRILIFFVTIVLVVGYSYQDQYQVLPSSPGVGWDVAWRRFLLVSCGVTAAFLFSFFPPAFTIRRYQRTTLATTCSELGVIYCAVLSYASSECKGHSEESQAIVARLIAIRSKLDRLQKSRANVKYEFSLRGQWPEERYHRVFILQKEISYALSHLLSVVEHLEPAWTRALLSRTRFIDPNFQGDVLAVISMVSTALRTGTPLPQITPCPLIDRFMLKFHGLNVIHKEAEEDYGLPRVLSKETLEDEQYLMFCVGVSTAFGIVGRLDKLMVAVKEIVGEQYHIHGVGTVPTSRSVGVPLGSRNSTMSIRSPRGF